MEPNQIAEVVRQEIEGIRSTLQTHLDGATAERFVAVNTNLTEIRSALQALQDGGERPTADSVRALEERLVAQENQFREFSLRATQLAMSAGERSAQADEALFKGSVVKDVGALRSALRNLRSNEAGGETRAIDTSLFATGGKLSPETADRFIDFLIEKTVGLSRCTTRRMATTQGHVDKIAVSARKIRRAVEGVEPETAEGISTKRRTLNTVEIIWAEDLTLTFLEDNIERRGAESHIVRMLATQFGNDMNDLAWNGDDNQDSSGGNGFTAINDGWITLMLADAEVNDLNATTELTTPTNTDILNEMYRRMPVEFQALASLVYFVPVKFAHRYAEEVSTRETSLGDQVFINGMPALRYFGRPVVPEPHLYIENVAKAVLTPAENLYHGIQRQVTIDSEWKPRKRAIEFTITARNDYEYSTGLAVVLANTIPVANR